MYVIDSMYSECQTKLKGDKQKQRKLKKWGQQDKGNLDYWWLKWMLWVVAEKRVVSRQC